MRSLMSTREIRGGEGYNARTLPVPTASSPWYKVAVYVPGIIAGDVNEPDPDLSEH